MKGLFRGFIIKAQFGANFQSTKYQECNKIKVYLYIEYYDKCQKECNKAMHNKNTQKERIVNWFESNYERVLESEYLQVKAFVVNRKINKEISLIKTSQKWIYTLRKIKIRSEKYLARDIRCYFDP